MVKQGRIRPRQRHIVVPVSLIAEVLLPEVVMLTTTPEALASFPEYEVTVRTGEYQKPTPGHFRKTKPEVKQCEAAIRSMD